MRWLVPLAAAVSLAGCGPDYSPNTYASTAVQQANKVEQGVLVGVRLVDVSASGTTGAVAGGAAGGIVGSQLPGSGVTTAIGTVGGGLIGGLVGSGVDKGINDTTAYEYIVRKPNGELVSVTQRDAAPIALGQHVLVIAGSQARIVVDYTIPAEPKPEPKPVPAPTTTVPPPVPVQAEPLVAPTSPPPDMLPDPSPPLTAMPAPLTPNQPAPAPAPAPVAPAPPPSPPPAPAPVERQPTPLLPP